MRIKFKDINLTSSLDSLNGCIGKQTVTIDNSNKYFGGMGWISDDCEIIRDGDEVFFKFSKLKNEEI